MPQLMLKCEDMGLSEIGCPSEAQKTLLNHKFPSWTAIIGGVPYLETHPYVRRPEQPQQREFNVNPSVPSTGRPNTTSKLPMFAAWWSTTIVALARFGGPITTISQHSSSQLQPQAWSWVSGILPQVLVLLGCHTLLVVSAHRSQWMQ